MPIKAVIACQLPSIYVLCCMQLCSTFVFFSCGSLPFQMLLLWLRGFSSNGPWFLLSLTFRPEAPKKTPVGSIRSITMDSASTTVPSIVVYVTVPNKEAGMILWITISSLFPKVMFFFLNFILYDSFAFFFKRLMNIVTFIVTPLYPRYCLAFLPSTFFF